MDYFLRHHGSTASTSTRQREIIANISLVFSSSHSLCCMKMLTGFMLEKFQQPRISTIGHSCKDLRN
ncbi:hypothetical protein DERF_004658 [Dermatophagoides farinae]|uniref:Uncharacterized protein n=1 Tax=Dermatophagoides farinae TaxID=6954 RepID=A0A922I7T3_DERFA|nr:hypothetical protein DERF_004658 [Dermatophagoides farinae]